MGSMLGWHFVRKDRKLGYGDGRLVRKGQKLVHRGPLVICEAGLHACKRIRDALSYAPGPIICRVQLSGQMLQDSDKTVAQERTCVWWLDGTRLLHEFACRCADDALALIDKPDPRSGAAIKAKRDWLEGKITDQQLAAAGYGAWAAVEHAAGYAAGIAAGYAAGYAAGIAAKKAAGYAAEYAAKDAAKDRQNRRLTAMVCAAAIRAGLCSSGRR